MKRKISIDDFCGASVWSYTRVSTKDQFVNNGSIETQVKTIKKFAKEHELKITEEFDAEYESSKRINSQSTLKELTEKIRKTHHSKRPKFILIWSPSRFGRGGAEHISLFVDLRRKYNVFLYSVSTDHNTFDDRAENEFSTQLLYAQKENFNRQDTIIPGLINAINNGKKVGKTPRGYNHFGPRVKDPEKVQAKQEINLNEEGKFLKQAFQLKLYKSYTNAEIINWLDLRGIKISKQTICKTWKNPFYAGYIKNALTGDKLTKGHWEAIISLKEFRMLNTILDGSSQIGIPKINGKEETPLAPKFLKCNDCDINMTSYLNKVKNVYYYKCTSCNKTVNANTTIKSLNKGIHENFLDTVDEFQVTNTLAILIKKQLSKLIDKELNGVDEKKVVLKKEVKELEKKFETMEYKFVVDEISKEIFDKHSKVIKQKINSLKLELENLPSKMSNLDEATNFFIQILQKPSEFYTSLNYHKKRRFQNLLFPEGLNYSIKTKECRTNKVNELFLLTNSLSMKIANNKNKKPIDFVDGSSLVAGTGLEPVTFGL